MNRKAVIVLFSFFLVFLAFPHHGGAEEKSEFFERKAPHSVVKVHTLPTSVRETILQPERVVKSLNIKPGMSILDIGAGTGFFTFPMARALKGTGKIFATDIDPAMVEFINKKMGKDKYQNILPVLVRPRGVDPFYKKHSFDIILLSEVYHGILHPEEYLRQLRPSLKKTGRLYTLHFKNDSDFTEIEFGDFGRVIKTLIDKGDDFPVFRKLNQETQLFIKNWRENDTVPPAIRKNIVQSLNKMLYDRSLFNEVLDYYSPIKDHGQYPVIERFLYPQDVRLAKWLIVRLNEEGILNGKRKKLTDIEKKQLHMLNRILLTGIFQTDKLYEIRGFPYRPFVSKNSVISKMKTAGYRFVREYDFLPYHYFFEFKRSF